MFGRRNDAINVSKEVDPIVLFTPLVMPTRDQSSNEITFHAEYEPLAAFIKKYKDSDVPVSFVSIIAAAFTRTVHYCPAMNYFTISNRIWRHKDITISLIVLRDTGDGSFKEAEIKLVCDPEDTVQEISRKLEKEIAIAKNPDQDNGTADFAGKLLRLPVLPTLVVWAARLMDRMGILPQWLRKISPFHCSLFITSMMSINMPKIYHHLYNFGTCSIFTCLGKPERQVITSGGQVARRLAIPLGVVTDERICGGAEFAQGMKRFQTYLSHPELLELTIAEEDALNAKKEK